MLTLVLVAASIGLAHAQHAPCQEDLDSFCNDPNICNLPPSQGCGKDPFYARFDKSLQTHTEEWRCYSQSALNANLTHWNGKSSCYCTRKELAVIESTCNLNFTEVFTSKEEDYDCFRIPSLMRAHNGDLLVFAEARKFSCSDHDWNDLVMKRSRDLGRTWSRLQLVHGESTPSQHITIGNPAPVLLSNGTILMLYCRNNQQVFTIMSLDNGASWSNIRELTRQLDSDNYHFFATGPPSSLLLKSGRILVPNDHINGTSSSSTAASDDGGSTWTQSTFVTNGNECQAAQLSNGSVILNMRTTGQTRQLAISHDEGSTWSDPWPIVPNTTACEGSFLALEGDVLIMSMAYATTRSHMTALVSHDYGQTWVVHEKIYSGAAAYSSMAAVDGNTVALVFEADGYNRIVFHNISV